MRRIRLDLSYDGSGFCGWQIQAKGRTVQGVVEEALSHFLKETVRVVGAGRTDSGVHAERQSCHFDTQNKSIPADKFAPALNRFLPPDIRILESSAADSRFHARFSAAERVYRYRFYSEPLKNQNHQPRFFLRTAAVSRFRNCRKRVFVEHGSLHRRNHFKRIRQRRR